MTREQAINYLISSGFSEEQVSEVVRALTYEPREAADYENEIADLHNRLDIAEYDKERFREEVTDLEAKIKALEQEPCDKCEVGNPCLYCKHEFEPQESEGKE